MFDVDAEDEKPSKRHPLPGRNIPNRNNPSAITEKLEDAFGITAMNDASKISETLIATTGDMNMNDELTLLELKATYKEYKQFYELEIHTKNRNEIVGPIGSLTVFLNTLENRIIEDYGEDIDDVVYGYDYEKEDDDEAPPPPPGQPSQYNEANPPPPPPGQPPSQYDAANPPPPPPGRPQIPTLADIDIARVGRKFDDNFINEYGNTSVPGLLSAIMTLANKMFRLVKIKRDVWKSIVPVSELKEVYDKVSEYYSKFSDINIEDRIMGGYRDMHKLAYLRIGQLNEEFSMLVRTSNLNHSVNLPYSTGGRRRFIDEGEYSDVLRS